MKKIIRIDGQIAYPCESATMVETEPGVYSVLFGADSYEVRVAEDEITVRGRRFRFEIADPRKWNRSGAAADAHGPASIVAPMPGKIVRLLVKAGDEVAAGQGIVVVEAMKMQNELKAPRDGVVTAIKVAENDSVNAGVVLAVIDNKTKDA